MNSQEFVIWLKGFTEGVHDFNVTPKQWDLLKEKLAEVNDTIPMGGILSDHNTFRTVYPNYTGINPNGTTLGPNTGTRVTTTPGTTGTITIANPYIAYFGSSSYNPSSITYTTGSSLGVGVTYTVTSGSAWSGCTTHTYPNGTTVSYTAGGANEFNDPKDKTLLHD